MEDQLAAGWAPRLGRVLAGRWTPHVVVLAGFLLSLWLQRVVYPGMSWNRDEPVYLWQVDVLRSGALSVPDRGYPELFQPWLSAASDGRLFSQYTLGWPLVLTLGALLGSADLGVAAGAALAVAGTWVLAQELLRDRVVATVAALCMLGSPILAVQAGAHLNYLFTLGLGLLCVAATLAGARRSRPGLLVAGGLALGWIFFTRPYDAALWGLLAAVPVVVEHRRRLSQVVRWAAWAAAGAVPVVVLTLLLNRHLTGSPFEFPITVADPLDQFGFGDRRLMPGFGIVPYGRRLALESTARNTFWLPFFALGAHLGLAVAVVTAWKLRRRRSTVVLVGLAVLFPLGYLPFFGTHISSLTARLSGPIYYIPVYAAVSVLIAVGLVHVGRARPVRGAALAAALVLVTIPVVASRLEVNHRLSEANLPWRASEAALDEPSLVITSPAAYLMFLNPFGDNGAEPEPTVLHASDDGPTVLDLVLETAGHRVPYRQQADLTLEDLLPREDPTAPQVTLTPLQVLEGDVRLAADAAAGLGDDAVISVQIDEELAGSWAPATSSTSWRLTADPGARGPDVVQVPPEAHSLDVVLGRRRADGTVVARSRQRFYAGAYDGEVKLLAPGVAIVQRGDLWITRPTLPDLRVTASPAG